MVGELGDKQKKFEEKFTQTRLRKDIPTIVRLDGSKFSAYTKSFSKPFDHRIFEAMLFTTGDLLWNYNCCIGYTASDEITLIFPGEIDKEKTSLPFAGKSMKLVSLLASYASVRFNYHIQDLVQSNPALAETVKKSCAFFDGRAFNVDTGEDCLENVLWRMYDCYRNSVMNLAVTKFNPKSLMGVKIKETLKMLDAAGESYQDYPDNYKWGTVVKRVLTPKTTLNPLTNKDVTVLRSELGYAPANQALGITNTSEAVRFLMTKKVGKEEFSTRLDSFKPLLLDSS